MAPMPYVRAEYLGTIGTLQNITVTWTEVVCKEQSHTLYFKFFYPLENNTKSSLTLKFLEYGYQYVCDHLRTLYIQVKLPDIENCLKTNGPPVVCN